MQSERPEGRKTQASRSSFFPEDDRNGPEPMLEADRTPEPTTSVAPAAIDWPNGAPFDVPTTSIERPAPRLAGPAIGVALLALGIAIAAFAKSGIHRETAAAVAPPPAKSVEAAPRKVEIPLVDVASLPHAPTTGTVVGAEGHRLWIDGQLADDWTAVVDCGPHIVQVGSAGFPRDVVVPCGESIAVKP